MKKIVFLTFISLLLISFKEPASIKWYDLKEGLDLARTENKSILVFVYVNWCDKCQRMDKKVFTDKALAQLIAESFIPIKLNPEKDTAYLHNDKLLNRKLFMVEISKGKYGIGVPRTVLYNDKNKENLVLEGMQDPEELRNSLQKFLKL
jgi:thioredoxin-related protein